MAKIYQHEYLQLSVYGNAVGLVREHTCGTGIHLDIGCGYGAIAEPIRQLGLTYLGFDLAEDGLVSLHERGFETYGIDLSDLRRTEEIIREATGDRAIASLTLLDTLEHITNRADN